MSFTGEPSPGALSFLLFLLFAACTSSRLGEPPPPSTPPSSVSTASPNLELERLFEEDQEVRLARDGEVDWSSVELADETRRRRADVLLSSGAVRAPEDFYRAAMLFQHGNRRSDFQRARELALRAVELRPGYSEAKWLAAAALDRDRVASGLPQKYGTQYRKVAGRLELYPVESETTDEERRRWSVPSLSEELKTADQVKQKPDR
jgi:hypothetical protein